MGWEVATGRDRGWVGRRLLGYCDNPELKLSHAGCILLWSLSGGYAVKG